MADQEPREPDEAREPGDPRDPGDRRDPADPRDAERDLSGSSGDLSESSGDLSGSSGDLSESPDFSPHELEDGEDELDEETNMQTVVTVEINGLSLYTHHGVTEAEREVGQRLVLDIRLDVGEADATVTDQVEDTVDYAEVCQLVALIAQQRSYRTLERLCSAVADRLLSDFEVEGVSIKASKPEPPIPLPVEEVTVEVWREPGE